MTTQQNAPSMQPAPATEQARPEPWRDRYDKLAKTLNEPPNELRAERRKSACRDAEIADWRAIFTERATQAERVQSSESIDTPEFRAMADDWARASWMGCTGKEIKEKWNAVVAHIYARRATASNVRIESIDCPEFRALADAYHCAVQETIEDTYDAMVRHVDAYITSLDFRATASKAEAPAVACNAALRAAPDSQHEASLVLAAELLEQYAAYIRDVKYEDIERHPYLPQVEQTAVELRDIAANTKQGTPCKAEAPEGIDYRALLIKYMLYVGSEEGTTFVSRLGEDGNSGAEMFSDAEKATLGKCDLETQGAP